jgi:hypothetical protein
LDEPSLQEEQKYGIVAQELYEIDAVLGATPNKT